MAIKTLIILLVVLLIPAAAFGAAASPLPQALSRPSSTAVNGFVYICGGERGEDLELSDACYRYDPDADAWEAVAPLPEPMANACAVSADGLLYVLGGFEGVAPLDSMYAFDPSLDAWDLAGALPEPVHGAACDSVETDVFLAGGIDADGDFLNQVLVFDTVDQTWAFFDTLLEPAAFLGMIAFNDGLLITGGMTDSGESDMAYELLSNGAIGAMPALPEPRAGLALVLFGGMAVTIGGGVWNAPLSTTWVLDHSHPSRADWTWVAGPALQDPRRTFGAGTLSDAVIVAGGFDGIDFLASVESLEDFPSLDDDDDDTMDDDDDDDDVNSDDDDSGGCCG